MAEAAGLILSAVGTGLSLVSLIQGNLMPADHGDTQVKVTIACADIAPADKADSVSGNVDIRLFTRYGEEAGPPKVDNYINGGNTAYTIDYDLSDEYHGNQTPYIKVTGNTDAICIAWLTMTWSDGTDWVWTGQNGHYCGKTPWHYSDAQLGDIKQQSGDGGAYRPDCAWIDGDGSIGGDTTAFSVYLPYSTTENDATFTFPGDRSRVCNDPNFATYLNDDGGALSFYSSPPPINNANNYDGRKRDLGVSDIVNATTSSTSALPAERLFTKKNNKLIQSPRQQHSAVELCASDSSWGPSFISTHENKFCDMSTKTVYDVCTPQLLSSKADCFDMDTLAVRGLRRSLAYSWEQVTRWGDDTGSGQIDWA